MCFISPVALTISHSTGNAGRSLPKRRSTTPSMTSCTVPLLAAGGHRPVQCLTITAVQRECVTALSVITAELDPVRAPSLITFFHGHSAGMCLFRWRYSGFSLKQQRILAHVPVNTFGIDRRHTIKFCLSAKQRPYPTITIRGQLSDDMMYPEKHIRIISVKTAAAILPVITSSENDVQLLMRHPATTTDDVYSSSPGNKGRALSTFLPVHIRRLL